MVATAISSPTKNGHAYTGNEAVVQCGNRHNAYLELREQE
jgi:hypothetical protein